jgi:hypothetical protein
MTGVSSVEQYNLEEQEKMTERYPYDISSFLTSRNSLTLD